LLRTAKGGGAADFAVRRRNPTRLATEGRRRKKKMKATYIWQMINQVGRYLFIFFFFLFFYGVFVRFSTRGVQKHHKKLFGKIHVKNFWPKKLRKKTFFLSSFPMAFLCVSEQGEFKNSIKNFLGKVHVKKIWPKKLRKKKSCRLFLSIFFIAFFGRFSA
jgi:hypothetical protein